MRPSLTPTLAHAARCARGLQAAKSRMRHALQPMKRGLRHAYVSIRQHTSAYVSIRVVRDMRSSRRSEALRHIHICYTLRHTSCTSMRPFSSRRFIRDMRSGCHQLQRQYLYFCTSKASKLSASEVARDDVDKVEQSQYTSIRTFAPSKQGNQVPEDTSDEPDTE